MWLLVIVAVNISNPNDIPGWAKIPFSTESECNHALGRMTTWVKSKSFQIEAKCQKQS